MKTFFLIALFSFQLVRAFAAAETTPTLPLFAEIELNQNTPDWLSLVRTPNARAVLVEFRKRNKAEEKMRVVPLMDKNKWNLRLFDMPYADSTTSRTWNLSPAQLEIKMKEPDPPQGLEIVSGEGQDYGDYTDLAWIPNNHPVAGYYIYFSDKPDGPFTKINDAPFPATRARVINVHARRNIWYVTAASADETPMDLSKIEVPNVYWQQTFFMHMALALDRQNGTLLTIDKPDATGRWIVNGEVVSEKGQRFFRESQPMPALDTARQPYGDTTLEPGGQELDELKAQQKNQNVKFENSAGTPLFPDVQFMTHEAYAGWPGTKGLFAILGDRKIQISPPAPHDSIRIFQFDPVKERILAMAGLEYIIHDLNSGARHMLKMGDNIAEFEYWIIPGHDALLRRTLLLTDDGHDYRGFDFDLCNFSGDSLVRLPLGMPNLPKANPFAVAASEDLIVYGLTSESRRVLRVCRTDRLP